ncbi:MAG TPA: dihydrodipicolinate synthase family protein [Candidatus Acidoferrales bacterium]|nr:dihydrodipicolinate synthase family protein [Candidatus Acidoferrales bacterium]
MRFDGIFAPLSTPFTPGGERIDFDALKENISAYNRTALAGYVVCGSTGEANFLSSDETDALFAAVAENSSPDKVLIAGTGIDSLSETIQRGKRAGELGYKAVLVRTPHYYKPLMTHEALVEYYSRVADASPVPVLVYSIPQYTGVEVRPGTAAQLARHPNIVGLKESSGRLETVRAIIDATPKTFQTLVGSASILEASLRLGAVGGILGLADVLPNECAQLFAAARSGDLAGAEELQAQIEPVSKKCVSELGPAGVKYAMDCLGLSGGEPRLPLLPLTESQKESVNAVLAAIGKSSVGAVGD